MPRRVGGDLGLEVCGDRGRRRPLGGSGLRVHQAMAALETELGARRQLRPALRTGGGKAVAALEAELRPVGIVVTAGGADHGDRRRRPSARARSSTSRTGRPLARAMRRTSSNSGVAVITLPSRRDTLKVMGP